MNDDRTHKTQPLASPNFVEGLAESWGVAYEPGHVDLDKAGVEYLTACRRADCVARWDAACPVKFKATDFSDPRLTPYSAPIGRVLSWRPVAGGKGLLLTGESGRGKTQSVWQLVKVLAEMSVDARLWHATDLFATLQAQIKYGGDDARGWIEAVAARPILIIDDLGQETVLAARAEWSQSWFFRLLDLRLANGRHTIITTNMTAKTISGRTTDMRADPLLRRLLDLCEVVKF